MTSPPLNIAEAAKAIADVGYPVLMLDTCVILDVIRAPFRRDVRNATIPHAIALAAVSRSEAPLVQTVVASLVPSEFEANVIKVSDDLKGHWRRLIEQLEDADAACAALGSHVNFGPRPGTASQLADELGEVARSLIAGSTILAADTDIKAKAHTRVIEERAPSAQETQPKDSQIFEECLELARKLRDAGFVSPVVFCSSDKKGYWQDQAKPHDEIAEDVKKVGVTVTSNLPWAWRELGLAPLRSHGRRQ